MDKLHVDESRLGKNSTGIYVRAWLKDSVGSYDIFELTKESLHEWLKSRGGNNLWAESTVAVLLGHDGFDD